MAGCGEVDQSVNMLPSSRKGAGEACSGPSGPSPALPVPECAICLQTCIHPVRLPCRHVFCFLCVKGASWQSKRCALCRQEVPEDFLERPTLLSPEELRAAGRGHGEYAWYYEGRNGWWQYDERTSRELEDAFVKGKKSTEMLIAGFLYVADLENMVQYRRNEHGRRRRMKRDTVDIPKKGVAGLRLDADTIVPVPAAAGRDSSADGADTEGLQGGSAQPPASSASPSPDSSSLESSLSQLHLTLPSRRARGRNTGEEEEEGDEEEDGGEAAPNTSVDESESGSSEEEEDEDYGQEVADGEATRSRQRLLQPTHLREPSPPSGDASNSSSGGGGSSGRSRRPDGQCTVTEV